jgi:hypothetical protein
VSYEPASCPHPDLHLADLLLTHEVVNRSATRTGGSCPRPATRTSGVLLEELQGEMQNEEQQPTHVQHVRRANTRISSPEWV